MKINSWNPFKWIFKAPPTQAQIITYDLKLKQRQIVDAQLELIKLDHERMALVAQFAFLQSTYGEMNEPQAGTPPR